MDHSCLLDTLSSQPVRSRLSVRFWLAALLVCPEREMSVAGEKLAQEVAKFTLRDCIGREWQSELVFFKVDSARRASRRLRSFTERASRDKPAVSCTDFGFLFSDFSRPCSQYIL